MKAFICYRWIVLPELISRGEGRIRMSWERNIPPK